MSNKQNTLNAQEEKESLLRKELVQFYIKLEQMGLSTREANLAQNRINYFRGKKTT
jgi:hypothetical protein